jgi:hypothetical protein
VNVVPRRSNGLALASGDRIVFFSFAVSPPLRVGFSSDGDHFRFIVPLSFPFEKARFSRSGRNNWGSRKSTVANQRSPFADGQNAHVVYRTSTVAGILAMHFGFQCFAFEYSPA